MSTERRLSTWQDAETAAAAWMRSAGFTKVELTPPGADGGVDIRAKGVVAQVKFEARPVGRPALQRLVGAKGRSDVEMLFFSTSGYSAQAASYAAAMDIALFTLGQDGSAKPANARAKGAGRVARRKDAGLLMIGGAAFAWKGVQLVFSSASEGPGSLVGGVAVAAIGTFAIRYGWRRWVSPAAGSGS